MIIYQRDKDGLVHCVTLHKDWRWGQNHGWYDGPHCAIHLGFVTFYWNTNVNCKKCLYVEPETFAQKFERFAKRSLESARKATDKDK